MENALGPPQTGHASYGEVRSPSPVWLVNLTSMFLGMCVLAPLYVTIVC